MRQHYCRLNCLLSFVIALIQLSALSAGRCYAQEQSPTPAEAATPESPVSVRYTVGFEEAQAHYVSVTMEIEAAQNAEVPLDIFMPVWTPGSYLVREYAQHVDEVKAENAEGEALQIDKVNKNTWRVSGAAGLTKIQYRVYCAELSVRTNFVDAEFGILNGAGTFMTTQAAMQSAYEVQFQLPPGWQQAVCSLGRPVGAPAHQFLASNFDELVDSPIVLGNPSIHPFDVGGVTHYLVNVGGDGLWEGEKAAADAAKVVAEHQAMWGNIPYDRYYFLNVIAESGGGLEHDHSTLLLTSRWSFRSPASYKRWLGLVSHEFFHTWNVRRLRPTALKNYDYLNENYFEELWVAEGITSYYDDLALVRSGLTKPNEYLRGLSKNISTLQTTPGRQVQSLDQSSHDTWIKFYRPNENSKNTGISYYNKGSVVAFLLDAKIRELTNNAKSLDDVMRWLYENKLQAGYTNDDVLAAIQLTVGGQQSDEVKELFESCVYSTDELDYSGAFAWLGLQFPGGPKSAEEEEATDGKVADDATDSKDAKPTLRIRTSDEGGQLKITGVAEGSTAFSAGLNVDDEIIAINGFRVGSSIDKIVEQFKVGETATVMIARRKKILELSVPLEAAPSSQQWQVSFVRKPTEAQTENWMDWLHVEKEAATD